MIGRGVKHAGKACAREEKEAVGVRKERRGCVESSVLRQVEERESVCEENEREWRARCRAQRRGEHRRCRSVTGRSHHITIANNTQHTKTTHSKHQHNNNTTEAHKDTH